LYTERGIGIFMLLEHLMKQHGKGRGMLIKSFIFAAAVVTVAATASLDVYGYTAVRGTVTCKSGKVRKDADSKSSFAFGVTKDEIVTVIGEKKDAQGNLWYQIKVMNSTGYIRADLIKKSNTEVKTESTIEVKEAETSNAATNSNETNNTQQNQTNGSSPTVKGSNVIVREEASTKSGIRTVVQNGLAVNVLSQEQGKDDGKTWLNVSFVFNNNNYKGYIRSDLVDMKGTPVEENQQVDNKQQEENKTQEAEASQNSQVQVGTIRGMGVNIRKEPLNGAVICRLSTGSNITVVEQVRGTDGNIWCKINFTYNKAPQTGYVRSDFTNGITLGIPSEQEQQKKEEEQLKQQQAANSQQSSNSQQTGSSSSASIKGSGVRVREAAVTGNVISQLDTGYPVEKLEEVDGSDGYKWYKIRFSKNDNVREGYVRSDLVNISVAQYANTVSDADFETQIAEFPESYKASLRALHEKYPNWKFVPVNTGLDWNNVVAAESKVGKNLVSKSSIASWKSTEPQAYNWATNTWYGFDGGSWAAASTELIQYYLDPRNFLDDSGIFVFETLGYESYQNETGVQNILSTTFMRGEYQDTDGAVRKYSQTFTEAGQTYGINPYHLASRCVQEQGTLGSSQSISGAVSGLEGYFNYFNIGAYATGNISATVNGLYYAAGTEEAYLRPWNTRYRSIMGAAKYISDKYISVGQNTLYFQKFNVVNSTNGIYSHQYMSNVVAASAESARLRKAYADLNTTLVFRIPYYSNMPSGNCPKPTSDSNPNTYLSSLAVEGCTFSTPFSSVTSLYYTTVDASVEYVNIQASPVSESSYVSGIGTVQLAYGDNKYQVTCKAQNGASKIYTIMIRRGQ